MLVTVLRVFFVLAFIGFGASAIYSIYVNESVKRISLILGALCVGSIFGFFWMLSAVYVPATSAAVVENTATGNFKQIGPGLHIWPLQPNLTPFMSKTTVYNMRREKIEIGEEGAGIPSGSASAGNPTVFIKARGWASPNPDKLIELHKKYGADYANNWVEQNWITAAKTVQGQHPYDYLVNNREGMANEIEVALQKQLVDDDEKPLVLVSQLAITNFDFEAQIQQLLKDVAAKEFERQKAIEDKEIALQQQAAEQVKADTRYNVAVKDGETTKAVAAAEAEAIRLKYSNQEMSDAYLRKIWIEKWDGKLPVLSGGSGQILNMPAEFMNGLVAPK